MKTLILLSVILSFIAIGVILVRMYRLVLEPTENIDYPALKALGFEVRGMTRIEKMKEIFIALINNIFDFKTLIVLLVVFGFLKYEWALSFFGAALKLTGNK